MITNSLSLSWSLDSNISGLFAGFRIKRVRVLKRYLQALLCLAAIAGILAATGSLSSVAPAGVENVRGQANLAWAGKAHRPAVHKPAPAKAQQASAPVVTCTQDQQQDVELFALCPDFLLDFSSLPNGPIDARKFNIYTGKPEANQEAQLYTGDLKNLRIENGALVLQALHDPQQGLQYTSARIDTKGKEDFLYGKISVRAILPDGIGTWPAIWMLPTYQKYSALSPPTDFSRYLNDGEMDIAESVGAEAHTVYGIAHSRDYPPDGPDQSYYDKVRIPNNAVVYHDYELSWTPTNLTFSVDGNPFFSINKKPNADYRTWPYDQPFYLILNLAVGGSWGGVDRARFPTDGVDPAALPASMKIQSISYYSYTGPR